MLLLGFRDFLSLELDEDSEELLGFSDSIIASFLTIVSSFVVVEVLEMLSSSWIVDNLGDSPPAM